VVYGSRVARNGREAGNLLGQVIGGVVVIGALALLAVGSLAFLGSAGDPSLTPSSFAGASGSLPPASPSAGPSQPAISTPTPASSPDQPSPTIATSPAATPFQLAVREGPGYVTFGTEYDQRLRITDPQTSFAPRARITWSAHLSAPANSVDLNITVDKVDPASGAQERVHDKNVRPLVTGARLFVTSIRANRVLDGAGIYVVRYVRGDEVMAEGYFEISAD
jgi:hypothetical protein